MNNDVLVELDHVDVYLNNAHILRDISFKVHRGEVVAIMGANGSGKSTLMKTLIGVNRPASGLVKVPPTDQIGYVPQHFAATGGLPATAQEVVASGLLGRRRLRLPRNWREQVSHALAMTEMDDRQNDATIHLSGGQQQRVLIARALVRNPQLLILDEPVAGVDQPSQEHFAHTLENLIAAGMTVIVVLHELGELAPLITRAIVLRQGQIVHDGAPLDSIREHGEPDHIHVHHSGLEDPTIAHTERSFTNLNQGATALTTHRDNYNSAPPVFPSTENVIFTGSEE